MNKKLEELLFLLNPWMAGTECWKAEIEKRLPEKFIDRTFLKTNGNLWNEKNKVHLIVGPRQVGKSTAVWEYLLPKKGRVLFINCEEPLIREWCVSPTVFYNDIKGLLSQVDYLFFEEAQHLEDAGLFLKGLVDQKIDKSIIVTGSSSYHLHSKTRESLAGRATRTYVNPFSLEELSPSGSKADVVKKKIARDVIEEQIRYGSYPAVWLSENKETVLSDLVEAFVVRDASDLFKIKHIAAFRQLLKLIAWQIGNLVNYSEWASIVGVDNITVKNYVGLLEESGILIVLEPYAGGKRVEITSTPNVYFRDVGLRNSLVTQFSPIEERGDGGQLFENWVVSEIEKMISKDITMRFWRSKSGSEVDLVLTSGKKICGVEVKCMSMKSPKISRSSRSFIEAYKPEVFFIVNRGYEGEQYIDKTKIVHLLPESMAVSFKENGLIV